MSLCNDFRDPAIVSMCSKPSGQHQPQINWQQSQILFQLLQSSNTAAAQPSQDSSKTRRKGKKSSSSPPSSPHLDAQRAPVPNHKNKENRQKTSPQKPSKTNPAEAQSKEEKGKKEQRRQKAAKSENVSSASSTPKKVPPADVVAYAGGAFENSPPPTALPLPTFSRVLQLTSEETTLPAARDCPEGDMMGKLLFDQIQKWQPHLAGKITGMFLDLPLAEVEELLKSSERLRERTKEAVLVLELDGYVAQSSPSSSPSSTSASSPETLQPALQSPLIPAMQLAPAITASATTLLQPAFLVKQPQRQQQMPFQPTSGLGFGGLLTPASLANSHLLDLLSKQPALVV